MSRQVRSSPVGRLIGLVLVVAAIAAVIFIDWNPQPKVPPAPIRPLKTMDVSGSSMAAARSYPGKVRANREVRLAFQVGGSLTALDVRKGEDVEEGVVLAQLDARDFESQAQSKKAVLEKAREDYEKIQRLFEDGSAGKQEVVDYKAAFEVAEANANVADKALADTKLIAPFSGVIADTYVDNFENVQAKQPILSLQDVSSVEIEVSVPEERVIRATRGKEKDKYRFVAVFDYLPDREFDVTMKEFTTEADPMTQTYTATFVMPAPTDVTLLPGMTVTIREYARDPQASDETAFAIPLDAVPVDETTGGYYVWKVRDRGDGTATVARQPVKVDEMIGDSILVTDGLTSGDRIALAGVHVLQSEQIVKPFSATGDEGAAKP